MIYDGMRAGALDYRPCRYGDSRLLLRGPRRRLDDPYVAFLGGSKTYGRFIQDPFPALVERHLGVNCVNFGFPNAGVDAIALDPVIPQATAGAKVAVFQLVGAQNLSNRFYTVHRRRNDRFLKASKLLKSIYHNVDFAEYHFNRHMLNHLRRVSPEQFAAVRAEVQRVWTVRMRLLLSQFSGKTVLLWFADQPPPRQADIDDDADVLGPDPLFVTREMVDQLAPHATRVVTVVSSPDAVVRGTDGMVFAPMERPAAQQMRSPLAHAEAAHAISAALEDIL